MREVVDHIVGSVTAASEAQATAVVQRLRRSAGAEGLGGLEAVAGRLAAARHSPAPCLEHKVALVVAADHGVAAPGVDLGPQHPTMVAVDLMARGGAAVNSAARTADANLILVDAGIRGGDRHDLGRGVLSFRIGDGTADLTRGPAMRPDDALHALQTGIALLFSLADAGLDVLALGAVAAGGEPSSAALVAALTGRSPASLGATDAEVVTAALAANATDPDDPIAVLAALGGFEIGVLAGAVLAAASINVPVVLDDHATSAAALVATRVAPATRGYLFASHAGAAPCHRAALAELGLRPLFDLGLAHGEGTGAILALPMLDAASRVIRELE